MLSVFLLFCLACELFSPPQTTAHFPRSLTQELWIHSTEFFSTVPTCCTVQHALYSTQPLMWVLVGFTPWAVWRVFYYEGIPSAHLTLTRLLYTLVASKQDQLSERTSGWSYDFAHCPLEALVQFDLSNFEGKGWGDVVSVFSYMYFHLKAPYWLIHSFSESEVKGLS